MMSREADEKDRTKYKYSLEMITAWSYDMEGHADKCVERDSELAWKDASSLQQVANHAQMITKSLQKIMKQPERCLRYLLKIS